MKLLLDAILAGTAMEAVVLWRAAAWRALLPNLLSGMCLLAALRAALAAAWWGWICLALAAAGLLHLADLLRHRRQPPAA